jgi:hypothetical protein
MNENKAVTTTEEKIEFGKNIDFAELFRHAELFSGMALTFSEPKVREGHSGGVHIEFQSNNISDSCGIFGKILEYCVIHTFSNSVFEDDKIGELKYWASIHISYQHHDGGSNGMDLFSAKYSKSGGWEFKDVKPRA